MRLKLRSCSLAFALAGGVFSAGLVASLAGGEEPGSRVAETTPMQEETPSPGADAVVSHVDVEIARNFGVFRRSRKPGDVLTRIDAGTRTSDGENLALSRRAARTASGDTYYLVPGRNALCILGDNGSGGCSPLDRAKRGDLLVVLCAPSLADTHLRIIGLFPDGVEHVIFERADGMRDQVRVENNALAVDLPRAIATELPLVARWSGPNGETSQEVPIPPDALGVQCGRSPNNG